MAGVPKAQKKNKGNESKQNKEKLVHIRRFSSVADVIGVVVYWYRQSFCLAGEQVKIVEQQAGCLCRR